MGRIGGAAAVAENEDVTVGVEGVPQEFYEPRHSVHRYRIMRGLLGRQVTANPFFHRLKHVASRRVCQENSRRRAESDCRSIRGLLQPAVMNFRDKIIPWEQLPAWREAVRAGGRRLVVTNGCFDILHLGHVTYLETARAMGDALLVGLNGDRSARELKGPERPINPELDRAAVLAALESVSGVCIFAEKTATAFLQFARPDIYVKGGDYTLESLNPDERRAVEQAGGKISIVPVVPGRSTTKLLAVLARL
jgi:rfaE bifunctional protein nucleotidyltransferase chain/domain